MKYENVQSQPELRNTHILIDVFEFFITTHFYSLGRLSLTERNLESTTVDLRFEYWSNQDLILVFFIVT